MAPAVLKAGAALAEASRLESLREYESAARILDAALEHSPEASGYLRFQCLLLRAEIAVSLNDLGLGRGVLAEAFQIRLEAKVRESLEAELRRADDLESFLTHRGCAG